MKYQVVDRNGEPVSREAFSSERKAYEAMGVYRDHCEDIELPMKVVRAISDDAKCHDCREVRPLREYEKDNLAGTDVLHIEICEECYQERTA